MAVFPLFLLEFLSEWIRDFSVDKTTLLSTGLHLRNFEIPLIFRGINYYKYEIINYLIYVFPSKCLLLKKLKKVSVPIFGTEFNFALYNWKKLQLKYFYFCFLITSCLLMDYDNFSVTTPKDKRIPNTKEILFSSKVKMVPSLLPCLFTYTQGETRL